MSDTSLMVSIMLFVSVVFFLNTILPQEYQFMDNYNIALLSAETAAIVGTCVIATGLPCAGAIAGVTVANFLIAFYTAIPWLNMLILTPLMFTVSWLLYRLARGVR